MKTAILIVDVLQDFFKEGRLKDHQEKLTASINNLVAIGREKDLPIIWVRQEFKNDLSDAFLAMKKSGEKITIENTPGCQLLPALDYQEEDREIIKKRYSAFFKTELESILKDLQVDTIILAGINTHACIRVAAIDAYQRDYKVILATDCIDSYDEEFHRVSLRYLTRSISIPLTNKEIRDMLL